MGRQVGPAPGGRRHSCEDRSKTFYISLSGNYFSYKKGKRTIYSSVEYGRISEQGALTGVCQHYTSRLHCIKDEESEARQRWMSCPRSPSERLRPYTRGQMPGPRLVYHGKENFPKPRPTAPARAPYTGL